MLLRNKVVPFHTKIFLSIFAIQFILSFMAIATTEYAILNGAVETNPTSASEQALYGRPLSYLLYFTRRFVLMALPIGGYFAFRALLYNSFEVSSPKVKQFDKKVCERLPLILPLGVLITIILYTIPDVYNNLQVCWYFMNGII